MRFTSILSVLAALGAGALAEDSAFIQLISPSGDNRDTGVPIDPGALTTLDAPDLIIGAKMVSASNDDVNCDLYCNNDFTLKCAHIDQVGDDGFVDLTHFDTVTFAQCFEASDPGAPQE